MRVAISRERCVGHGRCYTVAPSVYEADDIGFNAHVGQTVDVPAGQEDAAREGIANCPEEAIEAVAD